MDPKAFVIPPFFLSDRCFMHASLCILNCTYMLLYVKHIRTGRRK